MKKTPLRMCVSCKEMLPKNSMIRVVLTTENQYVIDENGKVNGRGAYVCKKTSCMDKCLKSKLLNRSFKSNVGSDIYEEIKNRKDEGLGEG